MNSAIRPLTALAAAAIVVSLAGCVPAAGQPSLFGSPPTTSATASTTPKPAAAAPKPGDILTDKQASDLRKSSPTNGDWVYKTAAGVNILVNSHQLLPAAAKADAEAQLVASAQVGHDNESDRNQAVGSVIKRISGSMGKPIVVVVKIWTGNDAGDTRIWRWTVQGPAAKPGLGNRYQDSASAVAAAQEYINTQPQSTLWEVLVAG